MVLTKERKEEGYGRMEEVINTAKLSGLSKEEMKAYFNSSINDYKYLDLKETYHDMGFKEGIEQGIQQGIQKGIEQGFEKGVYSTALKMLRNNCSIELIKLYTELSEDEILKLKEQ